MIIAVTGANGHVGTNLCPLLLREGHQVRALVYHGRSPYCAGAVETVKGDVLDPASLDQLCRGADVLIHLAARISIRKRDGHDIQEVNVKGTENIVEACKRNNVGRLIHFSSIHALSHDPIDQPMNEDRPLSLASPMEYERTKARGEMAIREAVKSGLDAVVLNPSAILGPFDHKPGLLGQAILRIAHHKIPALVPGGYNWVDVRDVAEAAVQAISKGRAGEHYILSGHWHSLKELSALIGETLGSKTASLMVPFWIAQIGVPFYTAWAAITNDHPLYTFDSLSILKENPHNVDNGKARKELGFNPRPLKESLNDTLQWFRDNNYL